MRKLETRLSGNPSVWQTEKREDLYALDDPAATTVTIMTGSGREWNLCRVCPKQEVAFSENLGQIPRSIISPCGTGTPLDTGGTYLSVVLFQN